jgi:hypothetical protein
MKHQFTSSWVKGFAAGVLVCGATLVPFHLQQAVAQAQPQPTRPSPIMHAAGTFMLSAAGGQSPGVFLIDTRTGDTWYRASGAANWTMCGNPVVSLPSGPTPVQPQK